MTAPEPFRGLFPVVLLLAPPFSVVELLSVGLVSLYSLSEDLESELNNFSPDVIVTVREDLGPVDSVLSGEFVDCVESTLDAGVGAGTVLGGSGGSSIADDS